MLADIGHDDRIVSGKLADRLNELLRHDAAFLLLVGKRLLVVHLDRVAAPPGKACAQIAERGQLFLEERQRPAQVAEHAAVSDDVLVHLDGIDLEVHDLRARRKSCNTARHAIVKAHADGDEQIALLDRHVRRVCAVHACHAEEVLACGRHAADAHERRHRGNPREIENLAHSLCRIRERHAAAEDEERPLRLGDCRRRRLDLCRLAREVCRIALQVHLLRIGVVQLLREDILGDVDRDRPRTPRARDEKSLFQHLRQILRRLHEVIVLRDRRRDAADVRLLEGILADVGIADLPRNADERDRIHVRRRDARHEVRAAGAGRRQTHADLARRTRVAVRRMSRSLLVAHEDMGKLLRVNRIVEVEHRAARIAENNAHALLAQAFQNRLRPIHLQSKHLTNLYFSCAENPRPRRRNGRWPKAVHPGTRGNARAYP